MISRGRNRLKILQQLPRGLSPRLLERFPEKFNFDELDLKTLRTGLKRLTIAKWENAWTIRANNKFPVFVYPKIRRRDGKYDHVVIIINGFDERPAELSYYYGRDHSLSKLLASNNSIDEFVHMHRKVASMVVPIPFHHWRRPVRSRYIHLNSSQMIYDNEIRLFLGFEQLLEDIRVLLAEIKNEESEWNDHFSKDTKFHLLGYSIGGLAALSAFLFDKIWGNGCIDSCQLLASGVSLANVDFDSVQLDSPDSVTVKDMERRVRRFYIDGPGEWRDKLEVVRRKPAENAAEICELFDRVVLGILPSNCTFNSKVRDMIDRTWAEFSDRILYIFGERDEVMPREKAERCSPTGKISKYVTIPELSHYLITQRVWWKHGSRVAVDAILQNMFSG